MRNGAICLLFLFTLSFCLEPGAAYGQAGAAQAQTTPEARTTDAGQAQATGAVQTQRAGTSHAQTAANPNLVPANWPTTQFAGSKDPSVQKALGVLNDMIRALGGDAYLNIRDMSVEGRTYGFYHGQPNSMSIQFWRFWEWPDKDRWELTKQRDVVELNVGDKGYEITYKGAATQETKQLTDYLRRRDHSLAWVIRKWLPAPGTIILYGGTAMVERNLADQVTVVNSDNDSVTLSVDPRTHLPVKDTFSYRNPIDRVFDEEAEVFSNYRLVQGIQTPFATVRTLNGDMTNQRFVSAVSYNIGLAASLFEVKGQPDQQPKRSQPK